MFLDLYTKWLFLKEINKGEVFNWLFIPNRIKEVFIKLIGKLGKDWNSLIKTIV